jgi:FAD/FMN-containing dehydrogenase
MSARLNVPQLGFCLFASGFLLAANGSVCAAGDVKVGRAKALMCQACHGLDGLFHDPRRAEHDFTRTSPDALGTFVAFATSPEGERVVAIFVCYNGAIDEGERVLKSLREFGPPLADMIGPKPYVEVQRMMDDAFPAGRQNYWKSNFLKGLDTEAIRVIVDHVAKAPSPYSAVGIEQFSGAVNRVGKDDTAFNHRNARYNLLIVGIWSDPAAKADNVKWVRDLWVAMEPYSSGGVYVNYLGQEADEGAERVKSAYGPEKYARLIALKEKYDPTNLFRLNQNIKPSVG